MTLRDKLIALRKLFSDKRRWTQSTYNKKAHISETKRECYCIAGGLNKVSGRDNQADLPLQEARALGFSADYAIFVWNDNPARTIKDVRTRIDEALAQLNKHNKKFSV